MESPEQRSPLQIALLTILGVFIVLLLCWGSFTLMARFAPTEGIADVSATVRDVLIILLAIESIAVGVFLLLMLWQLYQLIRVLRDEVIPLLNTTKETVEQVKHTTTFVGRSVSAPLISAAGFVSATRMALDVLRNPPKPAPAATRDLEHELEQLADQLEEEENNA